VDIINNDIPLLATISKPKTLRLKKTYFLLLSFCIFSAFGQRTLKGKVVDEYLESAIGIRIFDKDTIEIGKTDLNGYFEIELSKEIEKLIIAGLGYEWVTITIPNECENSEIILFLEATYDFMSSNKIDRLRKKRFEKLTELHLRAFQNGLFKTDKPCVNRNFEPYKPELDKIAKRSKEITKENKENFELLQIGDTITIPFSGSYKSDGTERTSLTVYSYLVEGESFDCKIQGIIIEKRKNRKGYFLTYKLTDTNKCEFKSIVYNDKEIKVGQILEQNMKYFKVITE
jgi:hypothetical protein